MTDAVAPIGFVGLGAIGTPLVETMLRAGLTVVVYDLDAAAVDRLVEQGARAAASITDLAGRCSLVGVCVPADAHVRAVLDGPEGLLAHLAPGSTVAIHSTVLPETTAWAAAAARLHGVTVVEAAVTGGAAMAAEGRSTFLLGGEADDLAALEPILAACGDVRIHAGPLGQASRLKLCINLQTYATFMGVYEAATLAQRLGLSVADLKTAMAANGQLGEMTRNYLTLLDFGPESLAEPGMRAFLEGYARIIEKDLDLMTRLAADVGFPVPTAELARRSARRVYRLEENS
jgi:3-hydroxyisobutyrate dehydrogenase-like beta-hydroxyacid dehydrogenase